LKAHIASKAPDSGPKQDMTQDPVNIIEPHNVLYMYDYIDRDGIEDEDEREEVLRDIMTMTGHFGQILSIYFTTRSPSDNSVLPTSL
jgi:hypothetical protein